MKYTGSAPSENPSKRSRQNHGATASRQVQSHPATAATDTSLRALRQTSKRAPDNNPKKGEDVKRLGLPPMDTQKRHPESIRHHKANHGGGHGSQQAPAHTSLGSQSIAEHLGAWNPGPPHEGGQFMDDTYLWPVAHKPSQTTKDGHRP